MTCEDGQKDVQRESVKTPTHPPLIQLQGDLVFLSPCTHVMYGIDITIKQGGGGGVSVLVCCLLLVPRVTFKCTVSHFSSLKYLLLKFEDLLLFLVNYGGK